MLALFMITSSSICAQCVPFMLPGHSIATRDQLQAVREGRTSWSLVRRCIRENDFSRRFIKSLFYYPKISNRARKASSMQVWSTGPDFAG